MRLPQVSFNIAMVEPVTSVGGIVNFLFREQEKLQVLKRLRQSVGPDVPWPGFYTYGEIGPVEERNLRHLYTSVVLALR